MLCRRRPNNANRGANTTHRRELQCDHHKHIHSAQLASTDERRERERETVKEGDRREEGERKSIRLLSNAPSLLQHFRYLLLDASTLFSSYYSPSPPPLPFSFRHTLCTHSLTHKYSRALIYRGSESNRFDCSRGKAAPTSVRTYRERRVVTRWELLISVSVCPFPSSCLSLSPLSLPRTTNFPHRALRFVGRRLRSKPKQRTTLSNGAPLTVTLLIFRRNAAAHGTRCRTVLFKFVRERERETENRDTSIASWSRIVYL